MFQFPWFALLTYLIQLIMTHKCVGFPHSDIDGYSASYQLTDAFRRLARPSSPLTAKAFTMHAYLLNLTTHRCFLKK